MVLFYTSKSLKYTIFFQECPETSESANRPEKIAAGFQSTRTMEEIKAKYHELCQHPAIVEKGLDFLKVPGRFGITGRYMGRGNLFSRFIH